MEDYLANGCKLHPVSSFHAFRLRLTCLTACEIYALDLRGSKCRLKASLEWTVEQENSRIVLTILSSETQKFLVWLKVLPYRLLD